MTIIIDDFEGGTKVNWYQWEACITSITADPTKVKAGSYAMKVEYDVSTHLVGVDLIPPSTTNWSGYSGLTLEVYGDGTKNYMYIEIIDDDDEHWFMNKRINWVGYKKLNLRFELFTLNSWVGVGNETFDLNNIKGLSLYLVKGAESTVFDSIIYFDSIQLEQIPIPEFRVINWNTPKPWIFGYYPAWGPSYKAFDNVQTYIPTVTHIIPTWLTLDFDAADGTVLYFPLKDGMEHEPINQELRSWAMDNNVPIIHLLQNNDLVGGGFDKTLIQTILDDDVKQWRLVDTALAIVKNYYGSGICVDLESIDAEYKNKMIAFMSKVWQRFFLENNLMVLMAVPAQDGTPNTWSDWVDLGKLSPYVHSINIMTYDKNGPWKPEQPGPIAPIGWIEDCIKYAITQMPLLKIGMGFPSYAYRWRLGGPPYFADAVVGGYDGVVALKNTYGGEFSWDYVNKVPYYEYEADGYSWIVYFNNYLSLRYIVDLALRVGVYGLHFWKLGDEQGGDVWLDELKNFGTQFAGVLWESYYTPPKWIIRYYKGGVWITLFHVKFDGISEELNGHEEATFLLPNNVVNREFVLHDYRIKIYYDTIEVYEGILQLIKYSMTSLTVTIFNQVYNVLQKRKFTGAFNNVSAATVLGAITGLGTGGSGGVSTQNFGCLVIEPVVQHVGLEAKDGVKVKMLNVDGGSLTDIYGAIMTENGISSKVKMAVYSDVDGVPTTLLGISDEVVLTASEITWTQFHFSTPIALSANLDYWFTIHSDAGIYYALAWSGSNNVAFNYSTVYADGFTDPFGSVDFSYTAVSASFYGVLSIPGAGGGGTGGGECPTTAITEKYVDANSFDAAVGISKTLNKDYWGNQYFNIGVRNNCVACLSFDEGSGFISYDSSGHGNHGAINPAYVNFTVGGTTTGTEDYACSADYKYAVRFQASDNGYLDKIVARGKMDAASGDMRCGIYNDAAGAPSTLLSQTLIVTVSTTMATVNFPFGTMFKPLLVATHYYWLVISAHAAFTMRATSGSETIRYNANAWLVGYIDLITPFGAYTTVANKKLCLYGLGVHVPPAWSTGKYGKALTFNGIDNYVDCGNDPSLTLLNGLTILAWIYDANPASGTIVSKGVNYSLSCFGGNLSFVGDAEPAAVNDSTTLLPNIWYHVAVTYDGVNVCFYINGVLSSEIAYTETLNVDNDNNLIIGRFVAGAPYFYSGIIDEVLVFNRALAAGEIKFHYNCVARHSSTRTVDRNKLRSAVKVKGVDLQGNKISGSAGTGEDVQVLTAIEPADQTSIDGLAATALKELSNQDMGAPVTLPISAAAYLHPGDTLPLRIPQLDINSNYRIQKIDKKQGSASIATQKPVNSIEKLLSQIKAISIQQIASRAGVTFTRSAAGSAPSNPIAGDMWFKTDALTYWYYNGSIWVQYQPV